MGHGLADCYAQATENDRAPMHAILYMLRPARPSRLGALHADAAKHALNACYPVTAGPSRGQMTIVDPPGSFAAREMFSMENKTFLARQPIMDRSGAVVAHELLFRESDVEASTIQDGLTCTAAIIERAVSVFGTRLMLSGSDGFLKCNSEFLLSDLVNVLPASQFVLGILRDEALTPELGARCDALRQKGFRIALDDVRAYTPEVSAFLAHVDIVKLSWPHIVPNEVDLTLDRFKRSGRRVLAEKIDRREDHAAALEAGCDLFQGSYFSKPEMFVANSVPSYFTSVLSVLDLINKEAPDVEVERKLKDAPELVVNLLHLADCSDRQQVRNSRISSVKQALVTVGRRRLMRWCCILLYGVRDAFACDSDPLIQMVEQRARFMESAAEQLMPEQIEIHQTAYLTGMLSLIHVPRGLDARTFIERLPVSDLIRDAIVERVGSLGSLLWVAEFLEVGNYTAALQQAQELGANYLTALSLLSLWSGIAPSFEAKPPTLFD